MSGDHLTCSLDSLPRQKPNLVFLLVIRCLNELCCALNVKRGNFKPNIQKKWNLIYTRDNKAGRTFFFIIRILIKSPKKYFKVKRQTLSVIVVDTKKLHSAHSVTFVFLFKGSRGKNSMEKIKGRKCHTEQSFEVYLWFWMDRISLQVQVEELSCLQGEIQTQLMQ